MTKPKVALLTILCVIIVAAFAYFIETDLHIALFELHTFWSFPLFGLACIIAGTAFFEVLIVAIFGICLLIDWWKSLRL